MKESRNVKNKSKSKKIKKKPDLIGKTFKLFMPEESVTFQIYRNNGFNLKGGNEETFIRMSKSSFITQANHLYEKEKKQKKNSHRKDPKDIQIQKLEKAVLACVPDSDIAQTVLGWGTSEGCGKEIVFHPLQPCELKPLLTTLATKSDIDITDERF